MDIESFKKAFRDNAPIALRIGMGLTALVGTADAAINAARYAGRVPELRPVFDKFRNDASILKRVANANPTKEHHRDIVIDALFRGEFADGNGQVLLEMNYYRHGGERVSMRGLVDTTALLDLYISFNKDGIINPTSESYMPVDIKTNEIIPYDWESEEGVAQAVQDNANIIEGISRFRNSPDEIAWFAVYGADQEININDYPDLLVANAEFFDPVCVKRIVTIFSANRLSTHEVVECREAGRTNLHQTAARIYSIMYNSNPNGMNATGTIGYQATMFPDETTTERFFSQLDDRKN